MNKDQLYQLRGALQDAYDDTPGWVIEVKDALSLVDNALAACDRPSHAVGSIGQDDEFNILLRAYENTPHQSRDALISYIDAKIAQEIANPTEITMDKTLELAIRIFDASIEFRRTVYPDHAMPHWDRIGEYDRKAYMAMAEAAIAFDRSSDTQDAARYLHDVRKKYTTYEMKCPQHGVQPLPFDEYKRKVDEMVDEEIAALDHPSDVKGENNG